MLIATAKKSTNRETMKIAQLAKQYKFPILVTLFSRIGYSLWMCMVWLVVDKLIPVTPTTLWETYHHLSRSTTLIGRALIDVWLRWDAVHYMNIAEFGYQGVDAADTVFFPLYPYLVGALSKVTSVNVTLMGILVSSAATLVALICLYDLVRLLFDDENLAKLSVASLAFFPAAVFLHAPYTEAMFLCFSIGCILFLEKKQFITGGILACAAGLVRPQGILLILPICYSLIREYKSQKQSFHWQDTLSIGIAPLGFISYTIWRFLNGSPDILQSFQLYSNISFQNPLSTLLQLATGIIQQPSIIRMAELLSFLLLLSILVWMFYKKEFRKHWGILLYSVVTWLLFVSKTSVNGLVPQLSLRYDLYLFFAFVGIGFLLQKVNARTQKFIFLFSIVLSLVSSTLYSIWVIG